MEHLKLKNPQMMKSISIEKVLLLFVVEIKSFQMKQF